MITNYEAPAWRSIAGLGVLMGIEGFNEPNTFGGYWTTDTGPISTNYANSLQAIGSNKNYTGLGQTASETYCNERSGNSWLGLANMHIFTHAFMQADSVLRNYPLLTPSLTSNMCGDYGFQYLTIPTPKPSGVIGPAVAGTVLADAYAIHDYESGHAWQANQVFSQSNPIEPYHLGGTGATFYGSTIQPCYNNCPGITFAQAQDYVNYPRVATENGMNSSSNSDTYQARVILDS